MKAIVFDVDDTLYDQVQPFLTAYRQIFGDADEKMVKQIFEASRKYGDVVFVPSQKGLVSMEEMYIYRLYNAFHQYGIELGREEALLFQRRYAAAQHNIYIEETMKEILDLCKKKAVLGVITNGPSDHQRDKLDTLGIWNWIPEDAVFISAEVGAIKPDPQIFQVAARKLGATEDKYYVGDHYVNDMVGAKAAGWKTIWFNHRSQELPDGGEAPDVEVHNLDELLDKVKDILSE